MSRKGILLILDGYGEGKAGEFNAVENANTPFLKHIKINYPNCLLNTDSRAVGLPNNTMGGSEVGHMTIGAGRVKKSMQLKVDMDIESGEFFLRPALVKAFEKLKQTNGALHLAGLWSDKQIHSNIAHCFALIEMAKKFGVKRVFVHAFTDGRDCPPRSCNQYFEMFNRVSKELGLGEIASVGGRFYAMDRENNLERTALAIDKMMQIDYDFKSVESVVVDNYEKDVTDEFFVPTRIKTKQNYTLSEQDLLIFFNTRGDRMKQPVKMACEKLACPIVTLCDFIESEKVSYVYDEDNLTGTLSEYLSSLGKKQLKISESTKYAHVTYFFNGGREEPFPLEDRVHIETQKTNDYALTPFMRAKEITEECLKKIKTKKYDAIILNFSNPDMVGHTGNYEATVSALECLDKCVQQIVEEATKNNYFVLICADHGNAEQMRDEEGRIQTAHTLNPVKCVIIDDKNKDIKLNNGGLQDVAPTLLKLMEIKQNPVFEGKPLF